MEMMETDRFGNFVQDAAERDPDAPDARHPVPDVRQRRQDGRADRALWRQPRLWPLRRGTRRRAGHQTRTVLLADGRHRAQRHRQHAQGPPRRLQGRNSRFFQKFDRFFLNFTGIVLVHF